MPSKDISELIKEYNTLAADFNYKERVRIETAEKVVKFLHSFTEEEIEILASVVPSVRDMMALTKEDMLQDGSNSAQLIQSTFNAVSSVIEREFKLFKESL